MKTNRMKRLLAVTLFFFCIVGIGPLTAQKKDRNESTKISYKVDFGPVYPIEGDSYQVTGKVLLNDDTGEPETIGFDVYLDSFIGQHADYLAWVANSWDNPDMEFKSSSITKTDDTHYNVKGNLEFRRRFSPIEIDFTRRDTDGEIVLDGKFQMNTSDYFIVSPPIRWVPRWIDFDLTLVFDKPLGTNDKQVSFH